MSNCPKLMACPFFNDKMANLPSLAEIFKKQYCLGDNSRCARFQVATAGKEIPEDLFPNQVEKLQVLLAK